MALLDDVKTALRITVPDFDTEVGDLISAAETDLSLAGVLNVDETDPLIKRAITTYCKAHFGYDNPEAERFQKSYEMLKMHLSLAQDYTCYAVTFSVTDGVSPIDEAEISANGEIKTTNSQGVAVFYAKPNSDLDYVVTKDDKTIEGSIYVDSSKTAEVVL